MGRRLANRRFGRGSTIGGGAGPVPNFTITSVSQSAGTIDGGTTITVNGTGFTGGMTSALGAVTYVNGSTATIVTNAHASGQLSWTLQTPQGQTAGNQTFTYLDHPVVSAISPSSGPQTLTTSGVSITCSNLPAIGAGVTVSVTVGSNAATSVTLVDGTHLTCTVPTAAASGTANVVVTVDGVASTGGTGIWTYNPPPVDISATNVSNSGGTGTIHGLNFVSGCTASANINGTPTSLTISFVDSGTLSYTLAAGSYTQGTWPLTVTNPDGQSDTETIFQVTNVSDPQTILGSSLLCWYRSDTLVQASGTVSQWTDKSGNGAHLTASGTQKPTYNATSSNFNNLPSLSFNGTTNLMTVASTPAAATNTAFVYAVVRPTGLNGAGNTFFVSVNMSSGAVLLTNLNATYQPRCYYNLTGGASASWGAAIQNTSSAVYGYIKGTGASTENAGVNVGNMTEVTGAGTSAQPVVSGGALYVGSDTAGVVGGAMEIVEVIYASALPNSTQLNSLYQYIQFRYHLNSDISFTKSLNVLSSTGTTTRVVGAGFNSTTSCTVDGVSVTTTFRSSTVIDLSGLPSRSAGTYELVITNTNSGSSITISNGITYSGTKAPDTIFGTKMTLWNRADQYTPNGSKIASFTDLAYLGNTFSQGTAANQPTAVATDTHLGNQASASFTGTPVTMSGTVTLTGQTYWALVVAYKTSVAARQDFAGGGDWLRCDASADQPYIRSSAGVQCQWTGTGTLNRASSIYWSNTFVSNSVCNFALDIAQPSTFGVEVDNNSVAASNASNSATWWLGSNLGSANYFIGTIAEIIILTSAPTAGQLSDLQTYLARY